MMDFGEHPKVSSNKYLTKILVMVRNYYEVPEKADEMWASMASHRSLFDFNNIENVDDAEKERQSSEADTIYARNRAWGTEQNAGYPHFADPGQRHTLAFTTSDPTIHQIMIRISEKFPELELLVIPTQLYTLSSSSSSRVSEFKGGEYNNSFVSSSSLLRYLLAKVFWQNEFEHPIAYDMKRSTIVLLDEAFEQNVRWQNQNQIYYAAYINTIFDSALIQHEIARGLVLSYSKDYSHQRDLVYHKQVVEE